MPRRHFAACLGDASRGYPDAAPAGLFSLLAGSRVLHLFTAALDILAHASHRIAAGQSHYYQYTHYRDQFFHDGFPMS